jgi:hypothetical protein
VVGVLRDPSPSHGLSPGAVHAFMFYDSCQHLRYLFFFLARSVLRRDVFYLICFLGGGKSAGHFRVQMREDGFLGDAVVIIIGIHVPKASNSR